MKDKDQMERSEGERLHAQQQRNFWKTTGALLAVGFICGLVGSFVYLANANGKEVDPLFRLAGAGGVIIGALLAIYLTWRIFVSADEVEVADNLWGSLIGFYAYAILLPAWWSINYLGFAAPPDHWLIYGISMITAVAVYAYRKWQQR